MNRQIKINLHYFSANKSFYFIFALFILGLYTLLSLLTKIAPLTVSHTVYYCQKILSGFMVTLPHLFPPLLVSILSLIALTGTLLLLYQILKTNVVVRGLLKTKTKIPEKMTALLPLLNLRDKVVVIKNNQQIAFCYGLLFPKICISDSMINSLGKSELKAVLIHESYHVKNRDPLKILLTQLASSMFFFIPTIKDIQEYYILSKEIAADQLVIRSSGMKHLKLALLKLLSEPRYSLSGVAAFSSSNDLEQRIKSLTGSVGKVTFKISTNRLIFSFGILMTSLFLVNLPVYAVENGSDNHTLFMCPLGGECVVSCIDQGVSNDDMFSNQNNFSPVSVKYVQPLDINYSANP